MENDKELLKQQLDRMSPAIKKNAEVVTPEDLGQDYLLHVSLDTNIRKFTPRLTLRGGEKENREVVRICTSTSLLGALVGYAAVEDDFFNAGDDGNKGGLKIYALPFKAALKPNNRLVYDAVHSDEMWLVSYSKDTCEFLPVAAGKMFVDEIIFRGRNGKKPIGYSTLYVEVTLEGGIRYSKNNHLDKGYWKVEGYTPNNSSMKFSDRDVRVVKIDKAEYLSVKKATADMLSLDDPVPASLRW